MFLLPVVTQDLPLSSKMYPLAQEHTTEFCSSLQKWSQSPLSRLQNFRVAVEEVYWFSGQAGKLRLQLVKREDSSTRVCTPTSQPHSQPPS